MLDIKTFDARQGGNVQYKAFAHPLAAEAIAKLAAGLRGTLAVYDPDGVADALFALHPAMPAPVELYVHDTERLGQVRAGCRALALTDLRAVARRHAAGGELRCRPGCSARILPHGAGGNGAGDAGRDPVAGRDADQQAALPRWAELRHQLRLLPRPGRPVTRGW